MYNDYSKEKNNHSTDVNLPEARTIGFFGTGSHSNVKITECRLLSDNRLQIKFRSLTGDTHVEHWPLLDRMGHRWSGFVKNLIGSLLPDLECQTLITEMKAHEWLSCLKYLKCKVTVVQQSGYALRFDGQEFYAVNVGDNSTIGEPCSLLATVVNQVEQAGFKRAYSKVIEYDATTYETDNIRRFLNAAHSVKQVKFEAETYKTGNDR